MSYFGVSSVELYASSTASLANGASLDSGWIDLEEFPSYQISFFAGANELDLIIDSSENSGGSGVNDIQSTTALLTSFLSTLPKRERYMRFRISNSTGGAVTNVKIQVVGNKVGTGASIFPEYVATAQFTPAMIVRPSYYQNEVALDRRTGNTTWNKFGYNNDVDAASEEIVAAFGGTFSIMTSADTLDVVSDNAADDGGFPGTIGT